MFNTAHEGFEDNKKIPDVIVSSLLMKIETHRNLKF